MLAAGEELVEASAGEPPGEWPGHRVVVLLEGEDLIFQVAEVIEVGSDLMSLAPGHS